MACLTVLILVSLIGEKISLNRMLPVISATAMFGLSVIAFLFDRDWITKATAVCFLLYYGIILVFYFSRSFAPPTIVYSLLLSDALFVVYLLKSLRQGAENKTDSVIDIITCGLLLLFLISHFAGNWPNLKIVASALTIICLIYMALKKRSGVTFLIFCQLTMALLSKIL